MSMDDYQIRSWISKYELQQLQAGSSIGDK